MAEFYTFDPSADIQKSFQKAGAGIADIFSHLVATQKRDNEIADKMFQNIESLKKDVNIYGQKVITDKTNALLKDASKVILEGGKLDYSQLGSIRQRVSDIADDKKKYELGAELRKEYMQLGIANKDNITSFEGFIKNITAPLTDPNIKNATDLQAAMQKAYDNSLNLDRIGVKAITSIIPKETIKAYGTNGKGDTVNYEFDALKGSTYDLKTGKIIGPDANTVSALTTTMKAQMPEYFDNYRKRLGVNEDILPDNVIANNLIKQIGTPRGESLVQTATSVKKEEEQLKALETENKFGERKILAGIDLTEAQAWRIRNPIEKEGGGLNFNFGGGRTKENVNNFLKITDNSGKGGKAPSYLSTTISKPFAMNLEGYSIYSKDPKNPNKKIQTPLGDFEVNGIKKISGNRFIISGLQAPTQSTADRYSVIGANAPTGNRKRVNITLDEKGFDSLMNRLHGMGDADQVENLNTIEKMRYLSTTDEAIGSKTPMKMSYIYNKAQQEGKPILSIMRDAVDAGFKIYED